MPENFQQTVNLREKMKHQKKQASGSKAEHLARVYNSEKDDNVKQELQKINQPKVRQVDEGLTKRIVIFLAIILIGSVFYFMFFNKERPELKQEIGWYMIKLINNEVYYGQISDSSANPVVISKVYYNYGQVDGGGEDVDETGNIRLVKRGKETHGPSGTMYIYQVQIEIIDELSQDSKVLQAIIEYEK